MLDITEHINNTVPASLRTAFNTDWLKALLTPIDTLLDDFNAYVEATRTEMSYTGQTVHLQRMLNDKFDNSLRRIKIIQSIQDGTYWFLEAEGQAPVYLFLESEAEDPIYLTFDSEIDSDEIDGFIVQLPTSLGSYENQIRGQVLLFKLAGINYDLELI